jgi:hypothetical protein
MNAPFSLLALITCHKYVAYGTPKQINHLLPKQINHLLSLLITNHSTVVTIKEKEWMAHTFGHKLSLCQDT